MPEGKMRHPAVWGTFAKTKVPRASKARKLTPRMARQHQKTNHSKQAEKMSAPIGAISPG